MDMGFELYKVINDFEWARFYELPFYSYQLFLMFDKECETEGVLYDVVMACNENRCSMDKILENETRFIFQITGIVNSIVAVSVHKANLMDVETQEYYEGDEPEQYFEML